MKKLTAMFAALGLVQASGVLVTTTGNLSFSKDGKPKLGDSSIESGSFKLETGFSIELKDGKVVDFGFEETPEATPEATPEVNPVVKKTPEATPEVITISVEEQVAAKVEAILAEKEAKAAAAKTAKDAADAEAARIQAIEDENEALKKGQKIPKGGVKTGEIDSNLYTQKKIGGVTRSILK